MNVFPPIAIPDGTSPVAAGGQRQGKQASELFAKELDRRMAKSRRAVQDGLAVPAQEATSQGVGALSDALSDVLAGATSEESAGSSFDLASWREQMKSRVQVADKVQVAGSSKVKPKDLDAIKNKLADRGVSEEVLANLSERALSTAGLTWAQLAQGLTEAVSSQSAPADITETDRTLISGLLAKIGCNPEESKVVLDDLQSGRPTNALRLVQAKIASMDQADTALVSEGELAALGRATWLSDEARGKLAQLLETSQGEMTPEDLGRMASVIKQDLDLAKETRQERIESLSSVVSEAFAHSKSELIRQERADNMTDTEAKDAYLRSLADKHARKAEETADSPLDASQDSSKDVDSSLLPPIAERSGSEARHEETGQEDAREATTAKSKDGHQELQTLESEVPDDIEAEQDKDAGQTKAAHEAWLSTSRELASRGGQASAKVSGDQTPYVTAAEVASQVENGILTNLGDGVTQLTIELSPENLGTLNVVIQVHGKEVQALIRSDNQETAQLLTEQSARIKDSLENQGLKVARIEIETQLPQTGYGWSGGEAAQQEQMRRDAEELNRMIARGRMARSPVEGMAWDVQDVVYQAGASRQGVDLFA